MATANPSSQPCAVQADVDMDTEPCLACPPGFNKVFVKYNSSCKYLREIIFKPNEMRVPDPAKPSGRTLLLAMVPPYCNEKSLMKMFCKFGKIESIFFESTLRGKSPAQPFSLVRELTDEDLKYFPKDEVSGYRFAYIIFENSESVSKAMSQKVKPIPTLLSEDNDIGMKKWIKNYNNQYPDRKLLQENTDSYMARYDAAVKQREENEKLAGEEDEDGWTKVTRGGNTPMIPRTGANQLRAKQKERMRNKRKDLLNDYSYQVRESKKQKIVELRQKFEEDKQRVQEMVDSRKFKPF